MSSTFVDRPSSDLLFIDFDSVAHRLHHAIKIELLVPGNALRHLGDKALSNGAVRSGVILGQQIKDAGRQNLFRQMVRVRRFERINFASLRRVRCAACAARDWSVGL